MHDTNGGTRISIRAVHSLNEAQTLAPGYEAGHAPLVNGAMSGVNALLICCQLID